MEEEHSRFFQDAFADFIHDAASGGAIRHLVDAGYSVNQIMDKLDFPTPRERVVRMQFALRFFLVALLGGMIGAAAGAGCSVPVLNAVFSLFGVSKVLAEYTVSTFVGAVAFVSVSVFVFSYLVSGRVKRVVIRELVTE